MAIVSIPLLGSASGKFADAEFMKLSGRNILRSKKLKRYKTVNATNFYYQQLLKKIILAVSPIMPFLSHSYRRTPRFLNFINFWVKQNYHLFSLNSANYLMCSNSQILRFSVPEFQVIVSASIFSYSGTQLIFETDLLATYLTGEYDFYLVLSTDNFRTSIMNLASIHDVGSKQLIFYYNSPPFNSADYDCFIILYHKQTKKYSNTSFLFRFSH